MDFAYIVIATDIDMKGNLKIVCIMVMEKKLGMIQQHLKDNIKMEGETEKD